MDFYSKLLNFFSKKDRTKKEVLDFLQRSGVSESDSAFFISKLESQNILNEKRYLELYIKNKTEEFWSQEKIKFKLIEKGFGEQVSIEYFQKFENEFYLSNLEKLIQKKIKNTNPEKLYIYLLKNGFKEEDIDLLFKKLQIASIEKNYES